MKNLTAILIFSFLFCTINAQNKITELPFYNYFLWYNGTIGKQPVKVKVAVTRGEYDVYYAYDHDKKWFHLIDTTTKSTTITGNAKIEFDNKLDGSVKLQMKDLWKLTGQLTNNSGEILPISLTVALKELPDSIKNTSLKNEFAPLALNTTIKSDSISVYYAEQAKANGKRVFEKQTYTKEYLDANNQINYVDINYDGYLDITISDAIYVFNKQKKRFEVENGESGIYPGIEYMGAYDLYDHTFESSGFRITVWYKAINGVITLYEMESYTEYDDPKNHNVGISENRTRYIDGTAKYSILDLSLNNDSIQNVDELVKRFIGDTQMEIMRGAKLILRHPSGKNYHYKYEIKTWKPVFIEFNGEKNYPKVKEIWDNGQPKYIGFRDEEGRPTGKCTNYFPSGSIYSIETFHENKRDWLLYYDNGNIRESGSYINNRKTGEWLEYDNKGCLTSIGTIKNGAYDGVRKQYFMGKLAAIEHYKNKKKSGKWLWYRGDNKLHKEENYVEGEAHGEFKNFFDNGNLVYERYYQNGIPIGVHKEYYESGVLKIATTYKEGKKFLKINYDESGKVRNIKTFDVDKNLAKSFYENGTLGAIGHNNFIEGGQQIGKWKFYHDNGKLYYKGRYEEGKRVGKWKGWYANGKRKFKGKYVADEKAGLWKYYDENGKLKTSKNY